MHQSESTQRPFIGLTRYKQDIKAIMTFRKVIKKHKKYCYI